MLRDVSFPHLLLITNIPGKHLVLRNSKDQIFEKIFPRSAVGRWRCSYFIALFKGRGSRQMRNFPFGFSTITRPFTQSVGFSIGSIMSSRSTICLSSFSSFGLSACETLRTGVSTGLTLSFTSIWWVVRISLKSLFLRNNHKILRKTFHCLFQFYKLFL